mgnify:CR=1 FL=1
MNIDTDWEIMKTTTDGGRKCAVSLTDAELVYRGCFISRPSRAIIEALVTVKEAEITELPVIYSILDLDALDDLFRSPDKMRYPGELSFCIGQYRFFLSTDGFVDVYDIDGTNKE